MRSHLYKTHGDGLLALSEFPSSSTNVTNIGARLTNSHRRLFNSKNTADDIIKSFAFF
jgi:hypothetical protein